jgi:mannose-6-phosphate isomerase-like protein (cupin superfamily)
MGARGGQGVSSMKKFVRVPGDPVLSGTLFSNDKFPGMHQGEHEIVILTGPQRIFDSYGLGHIPAEHMQFVVVRYERHGVTLKHIHPDQVQLYYVVSGQATVTIDKSEIVMGPGCFAHIPPHEPHGFRNDGPEPLLLLDVHSYCFENEAPTTLTVDPVALDKGETREHAGHPDREMAFFVLEGEGTVTVADETAEIGRNSLVFVPRNAAYCLSNGRNAPFRLLCVASLEDTSASATRSEPIPIISPMN